MEVSVQLSPLLLEAYYVKELSFAVRPHYEGEVPLQFQHGLAIQQRDLFNPEPLTINVQTGGGYHAEDPLRWKCIVVVDSQNPPERRFPYDFHAVFVGYFRIDEQVPVELRELMVKVNGASILYSAARELVATVTGRGPLPGVVLPTVVFNPIAAQPQSAKAEGEKAARKKKKKAARKSAAKKTGRSKKQQR